MVIPSKPRNGQTNRKREGEPRFATIHHTNWEQPTEHNEPETNKPKRKRQRRTNRCPQTFNVRHVNARKCK
jgi:hypothetical protein